jgi:hypothetical protein
MGHDRGRGKWWRVRAGGWPGFVLSDAGQAMRGGAPGDSGAAIDAARKRM